MPDKKWVYDTVALSNFLLSESAFIIEERHRRKAVITTQVLDELSAGFAKYPVLKTIDDLIENGTICVYTMKRQERMVYTELNGQLGKGEASCLAMAQQQGWIVVTDDRPARRVCAQMHVTVTGTIGIIKASLLDGQITLKQANDILQQMTQCGFYSPVRRMDDLK